MSRLMHPYPLMEKEAMPPWMAALWKGTKQQAGRLGTTALDFGKKWAPKAKDLAVDTAKRVRSSPTTEAIGKALDKAFRPVLAPVGRVGQFTTDAVRNSLDLGDDAVQYGRWRMTPTAAKPSGTGAFGRNPTPAPTRLGPGGYGPAKPAFGTRNIDPTNADPMSLRNLGIGAGTLYGGARMTGMIGGGSEPSSGSGMAAPAAMSGQDAPYSPPSSGGFGGFLSGIPKEMQYAAAAGIPLALLGAYHGGGAGLGMGALGLGALGLGAAGSGYFGDDARRLVGQGAHSLMGFFGGAKDGDIMGQIEQLSSLSPEFGVTMLMGKNPGMSREEAEQMYHFLTQNKATISKMLPQITGAQTPAVKAGAAMALGLNLEKAARCWKGYEPVPGKKPYTDGSCRPARSKKKTEKKADYPPTTSLATATPFSPSPILTSGSGYGPAPSRPAPAPAPAPVRGTGMAQSAATAKAYAGKQPAPPQQMQAMPTAPGYSARPVGSTPSMTYSLKRPDMLADFKPNLTVSGGNSQVTPVAHESAKNYAPAPQRQVAQVQWDQKKPAPAPAPAKPAPAPELTADDYSMQAKQMLAELNLRRRQAGGEVSDAQQIIARANGLLDRSNKMRNAPGYKPTDRGGQLVQDLNAARKTRGGEVGDYAQRMQAINKAHADSDRTSWESANAYAAARNPQGAMIAANQDRQMGRPIQYPMAPGSRQPTQIAQPSRPAAPAAQQRGTQPVRMPQPVQRGPQPVQMPQPAPRGRQPVMLARKFGSAGLEKEAMPPWMQYAGKQVARGITEGIPYLARGAVKNTGRAISAMGGALESGGRSAMNFGSRLADNSARRLNEAAYDVIASRSSPLKHIGANMRAGGNAAAGLGAQAAQGAGFLSRTLGAGQAAVGNALQHHSQNNAVALPLAALGAYGAYQGARPFMPNVEFRSPIADPGRAPTFQFPVAVR